MELVPSFEGRHYKTKGTRRTNGREQGKGKGVSSGEFVVYSILQYGAMVDIYCDLVGWPNNTLYRIGPGSKPGARVSDRKDAQSRVYQVFGSTVGGVKKALSW